MQRRLLDDRFAKDRTSPRWGRTLCQITVVCMLVLGTQPAFAWGRLGHRASAKLAESRLNPAARAAIRSLLEPGESLADASTWADERRDDFPKSASWHYVNVPIAEPRYDARFCPASGCVVSKIEGFRRILADPTASPEARRTALRFLVHFVQDLHQPLHVGDWGDRGGNDLQLQFFGEGTNLHRIWDSGLLAHQARDEALWVASLSSLVTPELAARWSRGTVEDWANESLALAKRAYTQPGTNAPIRRGMKLGEGYQAANLPAARERLAQSGVRLAAILNAIWK
jgi:nuclease S1